MPRPARQAYTAAGPVPSRVTAQADSRVVYVADQNQNGLQELFSAPIDGAAAPLRISGAAPATSLMRSFRITPDSRHVYFLRDGGAGFELFRTRADGTVPPERRSSPTVAGGNVLSFQLDATGALATYLADQNFDGSPELFMSVLRARDHVR